MREPRGVLGVRPTVTNLGEPDPASELSRALRGFLLRSVAEFTAAVDDYYTAFDRPAEERGDGEDDDADLDGRANYVAECGQRMTYLQAALDIVRAMGAP
jgi:hypothetical protein